MIRNDRIFPAIYFLTLSLHIMAAESGMPLLSQVSKTALMPLLLLFLASAVWTERGRLVWLSFAALLFSWAGDVLLLFQEGDSLFFLLGLTAFLFAHVFYILLFHRIRILDNIQSRPVFLWIVILYYAGLLLWLSPWLGEMRWPVRIYGIVISFMLLNAMHTALISIREAGRLLLAGAALFVLSDSILAINKFYRPLPLAGLSIMLTYGLAQFFLTLGLIKYLRAGRR